MQSHQESQQKLHRSLQETMLQHHTLVLCARVLGLAQTRLLIKAHLMQMS